MIAFLREPFGKKYKSLMRYAIETSDAFSLAFCARSNIKEYLEDMKQTREELAPYLVKTRTNREWPGTISKVFFARGVAVDSSTSGECIDIYRASVDLLPYLYRPNRLFGWTADAFPQDPCFFRNGRCWFVNIAHEKLAQFDYPRKEDVDFLDSIGIPYKVYPDEGAPFFEEYTL